MSVTKFHTAMQPLLKHLKVDDTPLAEGNSYQITLDDLTINLVGINTEQLLIAVNLGAPAGERDIAWQLLEMNLFGEATPPLQISAVAETRDVMLWTQERLAYLDASVLIALFERFFDQALWLRKWVHEPEMAAASSTDPQATREKAASLNSLQQRLGNPLK